MRSGAKKQQKIYKTLKSEKQLLTNGIGLQGFLNQKSGEAKICKSAIKSLKNSNINFDAIDIEGKNYSKYKTRIVFSTSDYYKHKFYNNISVLFWEFEDGMEQVRPYAFKDINGVITFSTFCAKYFKKIAPKGMKIMVLPYPVDVDLTKLTPKKEVRQKYGIKPSDFVFFFNFSYSSSYFRKNPEGTLDAFALAFPKHEKDVKLVIKTIGYDKHPNLVARLQKKITEHGLEENVILIDEKLTDNETYSLINICDVYISLHRGEGFGLGMMEAMAIKKPVIATNYGGNTEFTKRDTALLVDYTMVVPKELDLDAYKYVRKWPEPNIQTAAKHMHKLYDDKKLCHTIGNNGAKYIAKNFNSDKFNQAIKKMLI
jgi:glycosyltransferase involved in cell wall biosynthesis